MREGGSTVSSNSMTFPGGSAEFFKWKVPHAVCGFCNVLQFCFASTCEGFLVRQSCFEARCLQHWRVTTQLLVSSILSTPADAYKSRCSKALAESAERAAVYFFFLPPFGWSCPDTSPSRWHPPALSPTPNLFALATWFSCHGCWWR